MRLVRVSSRSLRTGSLAQELGKREKKEKGRGEGKGK